MGAGGRPDVRWVLCLAECGEDRNENERRGGKTSKRRGRRRDGEEARNDEKEKKELRLGVGGAIRNYCGTIDKRRLRGRTTEDSLRPSDFPLFHIVSLFRLSSLFPTSAPSWTSAPPRDAVPCPRNLPDSSICNVRRPARYAPASVRSTWNRRFLSDSVYFSERAEQTATGQAWSCKYTVLHDSSAAVIDMIMRQISRVLRISYHRAYSFATLERCDKILHETII